MACIAHRNSDACPARAGSRRVDAGRLLRPGWLRRGCRSCSPIARVLGTVGGPRGGARAGNPIGWVFSRHRACLLGIGDADLLSTPTRRSSSRARCPGGESGRRGFRTSGCSPAFGLLGIAGPAAVPGRAACSSRDGGRLALCASRYSPSRVRWAMRCVPGPLDDPCPERANPLGVPACSTPLGGAAFLLVILELHGGVDRLAGRAVPRGDSTGSSAQLQVDRARQPAVTRRRSWWRSCSAFSRRLERGSDAGSASLLLAGRLLGLPGGSGNGDPAATASTTSTS